MKKEPTKNIRRALLAGLIVCCALLLPSPTPSAADSYLRNPSADSIRITLPPSGEVRIENRRGGVRVEVWAEDYITYAVEGEQTARAREPEAGKIKNS